MRVAVREKSVAFGSADNPVRGKRSNTTVVPQFFLERPGSRVGISSQAFVSVRAIVFLEICQARHSARHVHDDSGNHKHLAIPTEQKEDNEIGGGSIGLMNL